MVECDSLSIYIIACLVCSKVATEDVMLSLGGCVLFMSVFDFVFAILCVVCGFMSWVGYMSGVSSWGSMKSFFLLVLHGFDAIKV